MASKHLRNHAPLTKVSHPQENGGYFCCTRRNGFHRSGGAEDDGMRFRLMDEGRRTYRQIPIPYVKYILRGQARIFTPLASRLAKLQRGIDTALLRKVESCQCMLGSPPIESCGPMTSPNLLRLQPSYDKNNVGWMMSGQRYALTMSSSSRHSSSLKTSTNVAR